MVVLGSTSVCQVVRIRRIRIQPDNKDNKRRMDNATPTNRRRQRHHHHQEEIRRHEDDDDDDDDDE